MVKSRKKNKNKGQFKEQRNLQDSKSQQSKFKISDLDKEEMSKMGLIKVSQMTLKMINVNINSMMQQNTLQRQKQEIRLISYNTLMKHHMVSIKEMMHMMLLIRTL